MDTVAEVLKLKGADVWSIGPERTVYEALQLMAERDIGALLVLEGGKPVGILSERDYARKIALLSKNSRGTPVRDVMTTKVVCVAPERTVQECMAVMTDKRIRHLPVVDGNDVVGLVSIGDIVKAVIFQQKFIIDQLERYIVAG